MLVLVLVLPLEQCSWRVEYAPVAVAVDVDADVDAQDVDGQEEN